MWSRRYSEYLSGVSRSSLPHTTSVGVRISPSRAMTSKASQAAKSPWTTPGALASMPRANSRSSSGPASEPKDHRAIESAAAARAAGSATVCIRAGETRSRAPVPTRTRPATRSGAPSAIERATAPPMECPATTALATPRASKKPSALRA